jgi:site-specific DNA-cytosine methylase
VQGLLRAALGDRSKTAKYQALNQLTLRGIWLRSRRSRTTRSKSSSSRTCRASPRAAAICSTRSSAARAYGYAVAETTHDCGELGGLAQSRKRFLLVARHREKVPPFLYEPEKRPLRAVGEVLEKLPLPGDPARGGRCTACRRCNGRPGCGSPSSRPARTGARYGAGVADPRYTNWHPGASSSKLRVTEWGGKGGTVTGSQQVASGALSVADPRPEALRRADRDAYLTQGHYGVNRWDEHSGAVPAFAKNNNGSWSVADPRGTDGETVSWNPEGEPDVLPALGERLVCMIRALDGTWHRPFTTLELAALQSLVDPEDFLELEGLSDSAWRERIGNAVPPAAAQAIASVMGRTLLMAWTGQTFVLSSEPIWVQPIALALTVPDQPAADLF